MWRERGVRLGLGTCWKKGEKQRGGVEGWRQGRIGRTDGERKKKNGWTGGMLLGLSLLLLWLRLSLWSLLNLHGDRNGPITGQTGSPAPIRAALRVKKHFQKFNLHYVAILVNKSSLSRFDAPSRSRSFSRLEPSTSLRTQEYKNFLKGTGRPKLAFTFPLT